MNQQVIFHIFLAYTEEVEIICTMKLHIVFDLINCTYLELLSCMLKHAFTKFYLFKYGKKL